MKGDNNLSRRNIPNMNNSEIQMRLDFAKEKTSNAQEFFSAPVKNEKEQRTELKIGQRGKEISGR